MNMKNLDVVLFSWLNSLAGRSDLLDGLIIFSAVYLLYIIIFIFLGVTFLSSFHAFRRKHVELFIFAFASAVFARFAVTELIRFLYNRPRPFEVLTEIYQLVYHSGGEAIPSGHAAFASAIAAAVSFYYPKISIFFWAAAILIGLGRVAAGVHWPSDILAGVVVGFVSAFLLFHLKKRLNSL